MRWPVFAAIVPDLVPRHELPAALALNGVAMNLSRVVGAGAGGRVAPGAGSGGVRAQRRAGDRAAFVLILRWKSQRKHQHAARRAFFGAMRVGLQHVRAVRACARC